jgi:putative SOS response-associated peptidase YedK
MCGRFQLSVKGKHISERFNIEVFDEKYSPSYNCAPTQALPIITNSDSENLNFFKWGLIPYWAKDPNIGSKLINARSETLEEKPSFRTAFSKRRCLIPSNGFFEWKKQDKKKVPYRIFLKNEDLFAMAGIWETWEDAEGRLINTFSILTTEPNKLMKDIHNRMPVILNKNDEQAWLFENDILYLKSLLKPFDASKMESYIISDKVNSPSNNTASIIEKYSPPQASINF